MLSRKEMEHSLKATTPRNRVVPHPLFLLAAAMMIFWMFGIETVGGRLMIETGGTIAKVAYLPKRNAPRYAAQYMLRQQDGSTTFYPAGPTDASLPRTLPVGATIKKLRWHLDYIKDGVVINDFPVAFYSGMMGLALALLLWAALQCRKLRKRQD